MLVLGGGDGGAGVCSMQQLHTITMVRVHYVVAVLLVVIQWVAVVLHYMQLMMFWGWFQEWGEPIAVPEDEALEGGAICACNHVDGSDTLLLFGGYNGQKCSNQLWVWSCSPSRSLHLG